MIRIELVCGSLELWQQHGCCLFDELSLTLRLLNRGAFAVFGRSVICSEGLPN